MTPYQMETLTFAETQIEIIWRKSWTDQYKLKQLVVVLGPLQAFVSS